MVKRRPDHPEWAVIVVIRQLRIRLHCSDRHPIERKEQHEDEHRHRQINDHDPAWQAVEIAHSLYIICQNGVFGFHGRGHRHSPPINPGRPAAICAAAGRRS
ncbi:hypothetical protein D9M72_554650 [compost metagenome]